MEFLDDFPSGQLVTFRHDLEIWRGIETSSQVRWRIDERGCKTCKRGGAKETDVASLMKDVSQKLDKWELIKVVITEKR